MRPHDSKASRAASGVGGVRGILKTKLWWRHGFPCDGGWVAVPRDKARQPEKIELTRSDLSRATYAIKELVADFPKALPKVVGKVEVWQRNVKGMLDELKPSVHGQAKPLANHFSERSRERFVDLLEALDRIETKTSIEVLSPVQSLQPVLPTTTSFFWCCFWPKISECYWTTDSSWPRL